MSEDANKNDRDMTAGLMVPRVMIAADASGAGKTIMTCALLHILKERGPDPAPFKCGPDYIDPMYHLTQCDVPSVNLDTFLAGRSAIPELVATAFGRYAVIEGVMGIYDGISPDSFEGSCYEIAQLSHTPIILTVDAAGAGRTLISRIKGILADDREHLIKGIILNRMSDAYYSRSYAAFSEELARCGYETKILGNIPKLEAAGMDSRHLGLKMPNEIDDIRKRIGDVADVLGKCCDIDGIIRIMEEAPPVFSEDDAATVNEDNTERTDCKSLAGVHLAVARDEAFCFYYSENLRLLERMGAKTEYFSPIHDKAIPKKANALLIGGGYPELYLEELSKNTSMLGSVRSAINAGMPSIAECGGFMYLHKTVCDRDGREYDLVGAVDGKCTYTGHLVNFGYTMVKGGNPDRSADDSKQKGVAEVLAGMRGHEFHYYDSTCNGEDIELCKPSTGKTYQGMIAGAARLWGWPHLYYPSAPDAVIKILKPADDIR